MSDRTVNPSLNFFLRVRGDATRRLLAPNEVTPEYLQSIVCDWLEAEGASVERIAEAKEWVAGRVRLLRFVHPWQCISLLEDDSEMPILWLECHEREELERNKPARQSTAT